MHPKEVLLTTAEISAAVKGLTVAMSTRACSDIREDLVKALVQLTIANNEQNEQTGKKGN